MSRFPRRSVAALATVLVLLVALPDLAAARPVADPVRVKLSVVDQTTWVARNTDFTMTLLVEGAPLGATVATTVYQSLPTRKAFDESLSSDRLDGPIGADLPPIAVDAQPLDPSGGRTVAIRIRVQDGTTRFPGTVNITQFGVHPVEVQLLAADGSRLSRLVTHLVRLPDPGDETKPVITGLVLPADAPPALQPAGNDQLDDVDRLQLQGIANGLALNPDVPATLVPTPETLDGLASTGDPEDAATLLRLKAAAADHLVLAQPYVQLDPSAWLAAGLEPELSGQELIGAATTIDRLGTTPSTSIAIAGRDLSGAELGRLAAAGTRVLVPDAAMAPLESGQLSRSLTRPFRLSSGGTTVQAFPIDAKLQTAFNRHRGDPVLAAHEILAELAMVFTDDASSVQGVALVPPSGWIASYPFVDALLDGLRDGAPVVVPTAVDALFGLVPPAGRDGQAAGADDPLERSLAGRSAPSLGSYPRRLRTAAGLLASLRSTVGSTDREVITLGRQLLVSGSIRLTSAERLQRLNIVNGVAAKDLSLIVLPENQTVTLASDTADIPLTIRNGLSRKVTVKLRLASSKRLEFPNGSVITKVLPPSSSTRVSIRIRTRGSGVSPLQIGLFTPDGRQLASTRYKVQSTAVSGVGLIITIGAAAFLVLWWARHWRRDRRERQPRHAHGRRANGDPAAADVVEVGG